MFVPDQSAPIASLRVVRCSGYVCVGSCRVTVGAGSHSSHHGTHLLSSARVWQRPPELESRETGGGWGCGAVGLWGHTHTGLLHRRHHAQGHRAGRRQRASVLAHRRQHAVQAGTLSLPRETGYRLALGPAEPPFACVSSRKVVVKHGPPGHTSSVAVSSGCFKRTTCPVKNTITSSSSSRFTCSQ